MALITNFPGEDIPKGTILGKKGETLVKMCRWDLPVPPGIILGAQICQDIKNQGITPKIKAELNKHLIWLCKHTGKKFGGRPPQMVSVRSSPTQSMPGMMDTILNVGITPKDIPSLSSYTGNSKFPLDCWIRLLRSYQEIIFKKKPSPLLKPNASILEMQKTAEDLQKSCDSQILRNPFKQLEQSILAIIGSWENPRAVNYRKKNNIPGENAAAVIIQSMVFGNLPNSYSGVVFSRSPVNGEKELFGEFIKSTQGTDIVNGQHTPKNLSEFPDSKILQEIKNTCSLLENYYRDAQDVEFTIEEGKLYILQSRIAKRTKAAATKIADDFLNEGLITLSEYEKRIPKTKTKPQKTTIPKNKKPITKGTPACPGIAKGKLCTDPEDTTEGPKILVRPDTNPEDIHYLDQFEAIITQAGGITSHAALISREIEKPCICAINNIHIKGKNVWINDQKVEKDTMVYINANTGEIFI